MVFLFGSCINTRAVDEHVWLHVEGKYIRKSPVCTDPNGIWMGCGVAHRHNSTSELSNTSVNQSKVNWISARKVNLVRISVGNLTDFSSAANCVNNYLAPLVQMYKAKKIYVIIDSHYYMHDNSNYFQNRTGALWDVNNPSSMCQRWLNDWAYIANYFKDEPWVAGYEPCNEPVSNTASDVAKIRNNYIECIKRIRQSDTKHIIFVGGHYWCHTDSLKGLWETGLSADEQYNPDPGYGQVVFIFHEYTNANELYSSAGGQVNDEIARIRSNYNIPMMCTEFGPDDVVSGATTAQKRRFEQEMIEMCYGQPDFWQDAPISDKAYPSRGIPAGDKIGWLMWRVAGTTTSSFNTYSNWNDIWSYAAGVQASPAPLTSSDPTPPSDIPEVRDGMSDDYDFSQSRNILSANWDASFDSESDISKYEYAIGTTAGGTNVISWTANGNALYVIKSGLYLTIGTTYYISVRSQNGSGLFSNVSTSNGQYISADAQNNNNGPIGITGSGVYPNPCKVSDACPVTFFTNGLASEIRILTLNGRLVKKIVTVDGPGDPEWNGSNEQGTRVVAGVYIYSIKNSSGKINGKIAILKN